MLSSLFLKVDRSVFPVLVEVRLPLLRRHDCPLVRVDETTFFFYRKGRRTETFSVSSHFSFPSLFWLSVRATLFPFVWGLGFVLSLRGVSLDLGATYDFFSG